MTEKEAIAKEVSQSSPTTNWTRSDPSVSLGHTHSSTLPQTVSLTHGSQIWAESEPDRHIMGQIRDFFSDKNSLTEPQCTEI